MKKKVLILYARYGSGHKSIAEYVSKYLLEHNRNYEVMILDMTSFANIPGKLGIKVMEFVSKYRPEKIFSLCYSLCDHKIPAKGSKKYAIKSYNNKELRRVICDYNPDITISSHFYCSNIISYYNKLGLINSKLLTIITDYHSHEIWTMDHKEEDGYIVSNELVKQELINRGVSRKKIYAFGLPMATDTFDKANILTIKKKYNIDPKKKTYLFFGGSSTGSMYYLSYFKELIKKRYDVNIIFVSGHNDKLKRKCENIVLEQELNNVKILGYTNDVFNLLRISDLVITKPGGATLTECLEFKVPMLLIPGVGGQEKYNARYVIKKRYGLYAKNKRRFSRILDQIYFYPRIINKIDNRLQMQSQNKSLEKINQLIKKM